MSKRIPTFGQIILDFVEATSKNRMENNKKAKSFILGAIKQLPPFFFIINS